MRERALEVESSHASHVCGDIYVRQTNLRVSAPQRTTRVHNNAYTMCTAVNAHVERCTPNRANNAPQKPRNHARLNKNAKRFCSYFTVYTNNILHVNNQFLDWACKRYTIQMQGNYNENFQIRLKSDSFIFMYNTGSLINQNRHQVQHPEYYYYISDVTQIY